MKRNNKNYLLLTFLLVLLLIGIGYAYLTSNLSITGATSVSSNTWDIHFANLSINENSVAATTPASIDGNNTSISYAITLDKPGDFYEFTVDIVNTGTLPGIIDLASISGIPTTYENIIEYSIKYENGNPVSIGDILNSNSSKQIVVKTSYKKDISNSELITSNLDLNLTLNITYVQSDNEELTTTKLVNDLKTNSSSCFTKYEGQVTDQVGVTKEAENVYFNKCADKRNIIFNNMCWQMIRTTETGGIKMVYNGEVVDGKCSSSRGDHKGIVGTDGSIYSFDSEYLYGSYFTYDIETNEFDLVNKETAIWSDSTYHDLIGKYTCKNSTGKCSTIYNINSYNSSTTAYASSYTIGDTNYAQIGTSPFNANKLSPALVGYMYNRVNTAIFDDTSNFSTAYYKYGNSFTYDSATNTYTIAGDVTTNILQRINDRTLVYTCRNTSGICSKITYVYYNGQPDTGYINLENGNGIEEELNDLLESDNVNRYNSSIKGIIDSWYSQKLSGKTSMLEDAIYCNDRTIKTYGNWKPSSNNMYYALRFSTVSDLTCPNVTDQFALENNKAKLTYPISLLSSPEISIINTPNILSSNQNYWLNSPSSISAEDVGGKCVGNNGSERYCSIYSQNGIRPSISLSSRIIINGGTGSETDPWIVQE